MSEADMRLIAGVSRCLILCTVLLVLPAIAASQPPPPPDLQPNLQPTEITFDASTAVVGGTVFFDSGVQNTGDGDSGIFNIKWFVNGQEVGAYGSHAGVPAGQTMMEGNSQFSWTFDRSGTYSVTFTVDVDNHIEESNEEDNSMTIDVVVDQSPEPQPTQLAPGWYKNSGPSIMYEDSRGRVVWENSYIYPHQETGNLYWYIQVEYHNLQTQPEPIICPGATDPSLAKVHIRGTEGLPPGTSDSVAAEETFCSRNPNFIGSLEPGGIFYYWAIFPIVPSGGEVSLELNHDPHTVSEWINPWHTPFDAPPPAECPEELVTLGTCTEFKFPWDANINNGDGLAYTGGPHVWPPSTMHSGLDFSSRSRTTHVLAMADGVVTFVGEKDCRYGKCKTVVVNHNSGFETWYVHLDDFAPDIRSACQPKPSGECASNVQVLQGKWLGNEGDTGADGIVHIHIELRENGLPVSWHNRSIDGWMFHENCDGYSQAYNTTQPGATLAVCQADHDNNYDGYISREPTQHAVPIDDPTPSTPQHKLQSTNQEQ